jgi:hypothetical protein
MGRVSRLDVPVIESRSEADAARRGMPGGAITVVDNGGRPTHEVDVGRCRQRLTELRARREDIETTSAFAGLAGVSEPTAARFLAGGHRMRIATVRRILRALDLRFEEVARPIRGSDAATGP